MKCFLKVTYQLQDGLTEPEGVLMRNVPTFQKAQPNDILISSILVVPVP